MKERVPIRGNSKSKGIQAERCVPNVFKEQQERQTKSLEKWEQDGLIVDNITGMLYTKQDG